jgi:hypothetical protein
MPSTKRPAPSAKDPGAHHRGPAAAPSQERALADLVERCDPPDPGTGATAHRFAALTAINRRSLSIGRLFEGHADGRSILREAALDPPPGPLAVWASEGPNADPVVLEQAAGVPCISGEKRFCSGASLVHSALVTVHTERGEDALVLVDLDSPTVVVAEPDWAGLGMREADTRTVRFDRAPVAARVGPCGWYLDRPGFWHGAVGVAACWLGGAEALAETLRTSVSDEPHAVADLGAVEAELCAMRAVLAVAAAEIDADPTDRTAAHRRALSVRAAVERGCRAVADHVTSGLGPRALAFDRDHSQRVADLQVYLGQHHGRRDLEQLGRLVRDTSC